MKTLDWLRERYQENVRLGVNSLVDWYGEFITELELLLMELDELKAQRNSAIAKPGRVIEGGLIIPPSSRATIVLLVDGELRVYGGAAEGKASE